MFRLVACLGLCVFTSHAATLTATFNDSTVSRGVPFQIDVEAVGNDIGEVIVPDVPGATIASQPISTSIQASIINGVASLSKTFGFRVITEKAGSLSIPPFSANIDGARVESAPLTLTVSEDRTPKAAQRNRRVLTADQVIFTEIRTDKIEAFKGEPVQLNMEIWLHSECRIRPLPGGMPEVTGFYAVPRVPESQPKRFDTRDGQTYEVFTLAQTLYPTTTGELRIGPWTLSGYVAVGSVTREVERRTDPVFVTVKPLPPPPANFSGSVGKYRIAAELRRNQTEPGVPATFVLRVEGNGNPDAVGEPELPELPGAFVDTPKRAQKKKGQTQSEPAEEFSYRLTPTKPGDLRIPSIEYCYFDADAGEYTTVSTAPLVLQVVGPRKPEGQIVIGEGGAPNLTENPLAGDILPIDSTAA
ncbi:MAG: BatD family protein, partial [Candidatus Hydrogenedentes bacterium]|nr:BatD family protein [Candidatus Hydrogenedentota bacterium]